MASAADLVATKLEGDRQPVAALVGKSDLKGLHYILRWHAFGLRWFLLHDSAGEATPTSREPVPQLVEVLVEREVR
jgi:hypothetical protein